MADVEWESRAVLEKIMREIERGDDASPAALMGEALGAIAGECFKRLQILYERLCAVEDRGVVYRGTWQAANEYARGDMVTWSGSMWHCNQKTRDKPGTSNAWTLAVKAGRDAT